MSTPRSKKNHKHGVREIKVDHKGVRYYIHIRSKHSWSVSTTPMFGTKGTGVKYVQRGSIGSTIFINEAATIEVINSAILDEEAEIINSLKFRQLLFIDWNLIKGEFRKLEASGYSNIPVLPNK